MTETLAMPAVTVQRCDPYGHATGRGPKHLMGGLFGPQYEGKIKWECKNRADGIFAAECLCGHRTTYPSRWYLCYEHVRNLQRRQMACCTRCVVPQADAELFHEIISAQGQVARLVAGGAPAEYVRGAIQRSEDLGALSVERVMRGELLAERRRRGETFSQQELMSFPHKCPMRLTEVS